MTDEQKQIACAEASGIQTVYFKVGYNNHGKRAHFVATTMDEAEKWPFKEYGISEFVNLDALPRYLNDANAALTLCDVLAEKGWNCELNNGLDKTWECCFFRHDKKETMHYAPGNTLPLAIVNTFLKAIGKDQP